MLRPDFNAQPSLDSDTLSLRGLRQGDFEGLFVAAGDPEIWAGHPARDRYKRDVFERYFDFLLKTASTLTVVDARTAKLIGCSRYYAAPDQADSISIGFTFLNHAYWGGATNFELKRLMLGHAFETFSEVWFHIDPTNVRSQKATAKLGARHAYDATLDLSGAPAPWMCFCLGKSAWENALSGKDRDRATKSVGGLSVR
jgi:RimJ/RimL family protein N-acetyltransferase